MPKYICVEDCHTKHEKPTHCFYRRGEVHFFKTCPPHFVAVDDAFDPSMVVGDEPVMTGPPEAKLEFDFNTAGEELLLAADYDVAKLREFAALNYGVELPEDPSKATAVARFVDARYRFTTTNAALTQAAETQRLAAAPAVKATKAPKEK